MAQEFSKWFYDSKAWKKCRNTFYKSKHGLCERCGQPGIIVHHKIKLTPMNINNPKVTLSWSNLELLCNECHSKEHLGNGNAASGLTFDEFGNLICK